MPKRIPEYMYYYSKKPSEKGPTIIYRKVLGNNAEFRKFPEFSKESLKFESQWKKWNCPKNPWICGLLPEGTSGEIPTVIAKRVAE